MTRGGAGMTERGCGYDGEGGGYDGEGVWVERGSCLRRNDGGGADMTEEGGG